MVNAVSHISVSEMLIWISLVLLLSTVHYGQGMDCYTCNVDFRSEPFEHNNSCLFPRDHRGRTSCSEESKYCQGIITRINGVFVQLQRTCETDCDEFCTEKGFGIETSECRFCCNSSVKNSAACGFQGYRNSAPFAQHCISWFCIYLTLLLVYEHWRYKNFTMKQ